MSFNVNQDRQTVLTMESDRVGIFLLYRGPVILKDVLLSNLYKNFLLLYVACYILCSDKYCKKYRTADKQYSMTFF